MSLTMCGIPSLISCGPIVATFKPIDSAVLIPNMKLSKSLKSSSFFLIQFINILLYQIYLI